MKSYTHFTLEERENLRIKLTEGKSFRQIALELGRNVSSISREVSRNKKDDGSYNAYWGRSMYQSRRQKCKRRYRLEADIELQKFVMEGLDKYWSPEIIAARWHGKSFSPTTVYNALKKKRLPGYSERSHLRRRGIRKYCRGDNRAIRPDKTIHDRPKIIDERARLGDWEGDTILGAPNNGGIVTVVDRRSRFLGMALIFNKKADTVEKAMCRALSSALPVASITLDNGSEFANFRQIEKTLKTTVYFTDTHSPWQRGTNENINGLIRFFFPKGTDFTNVAQNKLDEVIALINNRPRKCLGWLSPVEFLECCT